MTKKEHATELINSGEYTFEDVVELTGAKEAYIKGVYSKLGLVWQEHTKDAKEEENPSEEVTEISTYTDRAPSADISSDQEDHQETKQDKVSEELKEVVLEGKLKELHDHCHILLNVSNNRILNSSLKNRSKLYRELVTKVLETKEFSADNLMKLKGRYGGIMPRPNGMNCHREVKALHTYILELFREVFKK